MPTYEYECDKCREVFEIRQRISEPALTIHENCGGAVRRLLSPAPFILKGDGWYVTDYPSEARKKAVEAFGPPIAELVTLRWPGPSAVGGGLVGEVVHIDRFGNLVTSIPASAVSGNGGPFAVRVAAQWLPMVETYADLPRGRAGALVGSRSRLEVAVREGSAARLLGARRGTAVYLSQRRATSTRKTTKPRRRTS